MDRQIEKLRQELSELKRQSSAIHQRIERIEKEVSQLMNLTNQRTDGTDESKSDYAESNTGYAVSKQDAKSKSKSDPTNKNNIELQIGGTWLQRIGIVTLLIGIAFFLKYSFDHQWVGPLARVLLGIMAGIGLLWLGEHWKHKYPGYAQGLTGGGSLALIFSVYASYQFYDFINAPVAFTALVAIMAVTVLLALRRHSKPIAFLGIIGAYATPFLISFGEPSLWRLLSYTALITTGVLYVSIYKKWPIFNVLSFIFNQLLFLFFYLISSFMTQVQTEDFWPLLLFLIYNFTIYLGVSTIYNIRQARSSSVSDTGLNIINAITFLMFSVMLLNDTWVRDFTGYYALLLSFIYIMLALWALKRHRQDTALRMTMIVNAFIMLTAAIPLQFSSATMLSIAWLAEAVGLAYMAGRLQSKYYVRMAFIPLFLALFQLFIEVVELSSRAAFFWNVPTLLFLVSLVTIALMIVLLRHYKVDAKLSGLTLRGGFLFISFVFITVENGHYFDLQEIAYVISPEQLSLSALWLIYAVTLFAAGFWKSIAYLRIISLILIGIVIFKAFFIDLAQLDMVYKILLFLFIGLCLLGVSFVYQRIRHGIGTKE